MTTKQAGAPAPPPASRRDDDRPKYRKPVLTELGRLEPSLTFSPPDPPKSGRAPRGPKSIIKFF